MKIMTMYLNALGSLIDLSFHKKEIKLEKCSFDLLYDKNADDVLLAWSDVSYEIANAYNILCKNRIMNKNSCLYEFRENQTNKNKVNISNRFSTNDLICLLQTNEPEKPLFSRKNINYKQLDFCYDRK